MAKDSTSKVFAFLGIFLGLIGFVLVLLARRSDKYAMYYAKQSLVLSLAAIIVQFGLAITVVGAFLIPILWILIVILWVLGLVYSVSGKMKPIPIVGRFAEKIKL